MKKKRTFLFILFCTMTIVLTGSLLCRQAINNKNYFKSSTLAANSTCTVDGKSGSYNFTFKATELTSGVDYWQCHTTSGSWTTCPNSNACKTYKINADSGYDQIRTYDIAGNVSSIRYLYKKDDIIISGVQDYSTYVSVSGRGLGKVKIINNYYQREGTIGNVFISNEKISVTGRTEDCEKTVYYNAKKDYIKVCKLGTYNERTGKCEAESYRLQNDTCYCEYKAVDNKLKLINPSNPGDCIREYTFCNDEFRSSDNYVTRYNNATSIYKYGAVGVLCTGADGWGSSCDFQRPANSECNAHYDNIVNVLSENITSYEDYRSKIATGTRSSSTMEAVANLATAGNPCEKSGNYTASYSFDTACKNLEGKSTSIGVKTKNSSGETIYIVPMILSAPCNWVEKAPTENNPNYKKYIQKVVGDSFYYCDDDAEGITNDYQCYKKVTKQCYDYTVEYYYEG